MDLFYTDIFELPLPAKHRFPMAKYRLLRERLLDREIAVDFNLAAESSDRPVLRIPPAATIEELCLAHDPTYVHRVIYGLLTEREVKRIGFPWTPELVERSLRSTGASIAAGRSALSNGCSVNLAGGTHHAHSDCGEGYCVFNDACVAARVLQREMERVNQVLIVDCDVHQGNGSAEIASGDETIFTFSIHNQKNFPFRKVESDLDIGLPDDVDDATYQRVLADGLAEVESRFTPDLVFYLAGADPFENDKLGRLKLTKSGLARRDQIILDTFREKNVPVAVSMAGGYAEKVNDIVDIHFQTIVAAVEMSELFEASL